MKEETKSPNARVKANGGTVTALQIQKHNKERVNVFLDGEYAFGVSLSIAMTLKKGQRLSAAQVDALKEDDEGEVAFQRALRYLGIRPRSSMEITLYLKRKEYDDALVENVVRRLHEKGYLNDEAFAQYWVENRNRFRPRGAQALRQELRQKGVERETINATLEEQDEDGAAWVALEGKIGRWGDLEKMEFEQKVMGFLARRGFRFDVCRRAAARSWAQLHEEL